MSTDSEADKRNRLEPMFWACLLYIMALVLLFLYFPSEQQYTSEIISQGSVLPQYSLPPILIYFFGVIAIMGIILFLVPAAKLRLILRVLFAFFYGWGLFIIMYLILPAHLPLPLCGLLAAAAGLFWFFWPLIWLQNLLLLITLVSVAVLFGALISPFTMVYLLLAISVYDIVAVRFGYMLWMAKKLSETDTLPAFILPKKLAQWKLNLRGSSFKAIFEQESSEREFSLLGGGDMGFPLVFVVSVYFARGLIGAEVLSASTLAGVIFAYLLQIYWLKGRPLPAIPPISLFTIIGFLIVHYLV
jgi:presenilin-like A22 family membrane protease